MPVTVWPVAGTGRKPRKALVLWKSGFPYQNTEVLDVNFTLKIINYYNLNCTEQEAIFKGRLKVEGSMYFVFENTM